MSKKDEIFLEAARLFQEKGYNAASMRDLAERVQLKPSSLYSHIRTKGEILQKICFDHAHRFMEGMREVEQQQGTPVEKVQTLLALHIRTALDDPTSITVFSDEWKYLEEPYLGDFLKVRRDYEQRFRNLLQEGMKQGQFRQADAGIVLNTLLSGLRWLHYRQRTGNDAEKERLESEVIDFLVKGLSCDR